MDNAFNKMEEVLKDIRRLTAEFSMKPSEAGFDNVSGIIQDYIVMLKEFDLLLEDALDEFLELSKNEEIVSSNI